MIPESASLTPTRVFALADQFWRGARLLAAKGDTATPARVLYLHAAELFVKAFLKARGWSVTDMRKLQHDYAAMLEACAIEGLELPVETARLLRLAGERNDYVRARYLPGRPAGDFRSTTLEKLVGDLREAVAARVLGAAPGAAAAE